MAIPRLRPGQTPTAEEWNSLAEMVERQNAPPMSGQFGDLLVSQGRGGAQILDGRDKGHWAKIGTRGIGATYAHTTAASNGDGTFTDLPATNEYEYGTTTAAPVREINGNTTIAAGTYVWVWPDDRGDKPGWLFNFSASPPVFRSWYQNDVLGGGVTSITPNSTWVDCGELILGAGNGNGAGLGNQSKGVYLVWAVVNGVFNVSAFGAGLSTVRMRWYNVTASLPVPGTGEFPYEAVLVDPHVLNLDHYATQTLIVGIYATSAATKIRLQVMRGLGTWTTATVLSVGGGYWWIDDIPP